tara:strand:+ start:759 stop:1076 length:318 start_codon:yes stop_codon:yes gene_type:complete
MKMIDLEFDPVKALAQVTIMRNQTLTNKPDHKFIEYFDNIEMTLRKMREKNLKLLGRVEAAERQIDKFSKMGSPEILKEYEKDVDYEDKLTDDAWIRPSFQSKMF